MEKSTMMYSYIVLSCDLFKLDLLTNHSLLGYTMVDKSQLLVFHIVLNYNMGWRGLGCGVIPATGY